MSALRTLWNDVVNTAKEKVDAVKKQVSKTYDAVKEEVTETCNDAAATDPEFNLAVKGTPPTLHLGDNCVDGWVEYLQQLLNGHGFRLDVNGSFDQATLKALRAFQKRHKLKADGIAGSQTWAALRAGSSLGRENSLELESFQSM